MAFIAAHHTAAGAEHYILLSSLNVLCVITTFYISLPSQVSHRMLKSECLQTNARADVIAESLSAARTDRAQDGGSSPLHAAPH